MSSSNAFEHYYKNHLFYPGSSDIRKFAYFQMEINKAYKNLSKRTPEDIFKVEYKGHTFNVLPFLLIGSNFLDPCAKRELTALLRGSNKSRQCLVWDRIEDCKSNPLIDINLIDNLSPSVGGILSGVFASAMVFVEEPHKFAKILFKAYLQELRTIMDGMWDNLDYKCKDLSNVTAFSYYIGVLWFLQLSKPMFKIMEKTLAGTEYYDKLSSFAPENSLLYRHITGSVDPNIRNFCSDIAYSDGSTSLLRENLAYVMQGDYGGEDLSKYTVECLKDLVNKSRYADIYSLSTIDELNPAYYLKDTCDSLDAGNKALAKELSDLNKSYTKRLKQSQDKVQELASQIKDMDTTIHNLTNKLKSQTTDEVLQSEVSSLKAELQELKAENELLFTERMQLKRELSSLRKQNRGSSTDVVITEEQCTQSEDTYNREDYANKLKDTRLCIVGANGVDITMQNKLRDLGFESVSTYKMSESRKDLDFVVVMANCCSHSMTYQAEKTYKGYDFIYIFGTNIDILLQELYKSLKEIEGD